MTNKTVPAQQFSSYATVGTVNSDDYDNLSGRSAIVVIDITAITGTGTPSLTVTLQGKDSVSGKYYTILASTALTGTGTTILRVDPSLTASANLIAADVVPRTWRISSATGGSTISLTATIGVHLVG